MTTTFQRAPGTNSLRVEPSGWTAPEGSFVFVFGSDEPGREGYFLPGDGVEIQQAGTYSGARFVRSRARLRGPAVAPPVGWTWEAYATVGATERWSFELLPGETRDLEDLAINAQGFGGGTVTLKFGLRLVGPGGGPDPENLEIPAFYLDEILLDAASDGLFVANRSPEPDADGVPQDEPVRFDLMDTTGAPDLTATLVYIDGVLAYDGTGAGAQPGYTVTTSVPYVGVVRFEIVAPYLFESLRAIPVRVVSENVAGTHTVDESWTFTIVDLTAPRVIDATSRSHTTVRVAFDEPVVGATAASAYAITRLEAPSVSVEVVSVTEISPTEYDLELDIPITRGALYRVVVSSVEDERGNDIVAPNDRIDFRGYECAPVAGRRFEVWKMIPEIARLRDATRDLYKTCAVLQEVIDLLLCDIDAFTDILDVDIAAERYVDHMLIGLGNPFSFDLTLEEKRRLVRTLVDMYRLKGTKVGAISVVRFFLEIEIEIVAYLEDAWILGVSELGEDTTLGPGTSRERFSFDVISPIVLTETQREQIRTIIEYMKPAHTHFVRLIEPEDYGVIDHLELGLSELGGDEWMLH